MSAHKDLTDYRSLESFELPAVAVTPLSPATLLDMASRARRDLGRAVSNSERRFLRREIEACERLAVERCGMGLLNGMPHGQLMAGLRQERAVQERIRARAIAEQNRCGICDEAFRPGERTTYVDDERVHLECDEGEL